MKEKINKKHYEVIKNDLYNLYINLENFIDTLISKTEKISKLELRQKRQNIDPSLTTNIFNKKFIRKLNSVQENKKLFFYKGDLIAFGNTFNNLREFNFFKKLLLDNGINLDSYFFDNNYKIRDDEFDEYFYDTFSDFLRNNLIFKKIARRILNKYEIIKNYLYKLKIKRSNRYLLFEKIIKKLEKIEIFFINLKYFRNKLFEVDNNNPKTNLLSSIHTESKLFDMVEINKIIFNKLKDFKSNELHCSYIREGILAFLKGAIILSGSNGNQKIKFALFSNDHMPKYIALAYIARIINLKTIYIQHGGITDVFPKLDYDFSILYNEDSFQKYNSISHIKKNNVAIIPRNYTNYQVSKKANKDLVITDFLNKNNKYSVVIYLGADFKLEFLSQLVRILEENNFIEKVRIKSHPNLNYYNSKQIKFFEKYKRYMINSIPNYKHLGLCGTSSVVTNLVANKIYCFNLKELDKRDDYYGYLKNELITNIELSDLRSNFAEKIKFIIKKEKIDFYAPAPRSNFSKSEVIKFLNYIRKNSELKYIKKANEKLINISNSKQLLSCLIKELKGYMSEKTIEKLKKEILYSLKRLRIYEFIFDNRTKNYKNIFKKGITFDRNNEIRNFCYYLYNQKTRVKIDYKKVNQDLKRLKNKKGDLEYKTFNMIFKYVNTRIKSSELEKFMDFKEFINFSRNIPFRNKINLINAYYKNPIYEEQVRSYLRNRFIQYKDLKNIEKVREINCCIWDGLNINNKIFLHNNLLDIFSCHKKLVTYFKSQFKNNPDKYLFIDNHLETNLKEGQIDLRFARCDENQKHKFLTIIQNHLIEEKEFSYIRLSDGEGHLFSDSYFTHQDCLNRERHWWGKELKNKQRDKLRNDLKISLNNADAIGIPSVFRFMRDLSQNMEIMERFFLRGLFSILKEYKTYTRNAKIITEEKANLFLFELENVKRLAETAKHVVIISSLSKEIINAIFGTLSNKFDNIQIPPHKYTEGGEGYSKKSTKNFGESYENFYKKINEIVKKGTLVIVAAGYAGKVLINKSKLAGGIAIDVGESIDRWRDEII